jgi:putative methionine-R-sulfoxide reductase with GAF domain
LYFAEKNKFVKNPSAGETDGDQVTVEKGINGDQMAVDRDTEVEVGEAVASGDGVALTHTEPE